MKKVRGKKTGKTRATEPTQVPVPDPRPGNDAEWNAWSLAVLAVLVGISYFPAIRLGFVWDDVVITTLPAVREWSGIWDLWFAPGSAYRHGLIGEDHYWPLLYTTFWIEHKLWGFTPAGFHAVNILLHFANTALLWRLLARLRVPGAWWAAALFATHPLHVESVTWVIARKDLLATLFYFAAFLSWLRSMATSRPSRYAAPLALFAAALLCKTMAVTLPAALLLWCWWERGRVTLEDLARMLPFLIVAFILTVVDLNIYQKGNLSFDYSPVERTLIAARALWFYAGKLLWPTDLALFYPQWDVNPANPVAWVAVVAAAGVATMLWLARDRVGRGPLACVLFFAVTLSPVLGFVDFGYMNIAFAADRYQYLAGAGLLTLAAGAAARGASACPRAARSIAAAGGITLALLVSATWHQSAAWKDDLTLFSHAAATNSESWTAHRYAGMESFKQKFDARAETHLRRSLELRTWARMPGAMKRFRRDIFRTIGMTLMRRGRFADAFETFRSAAAADPDDAVAHAAMGEALLRLERRQEAVAAFEQALALGPDPGMVPAIRQLLRQALARAAR